MTAMRVDGPILKELNGRPAHELYDRYLHIENNDQFFFNVLEFPFLFKTMDLEILRTPIACFDDGSMLLAAPVPEGAKLRFAYGDPDEIMAAIHKTAEQVAEFRPVAIMIFPCGGAASLRLDDGLGRFQVGERPVRPPRRRPRPEGLRRFALASGRRRRIGRGIRALG
ncbi:MAG TPA: hypothetical protein DCP91_01165 [Eggerthellaceae bacterium]|nr:hypothetical protein [Eggerthellaceae bacterium]